MTTNNNVNKSEQLFIASANFRIWSGQRKLDDQDINFGEGAERPSDELVELGSKRIIDPKELNLFHRLKRETDRFLAAHGMSFLGGYACPVDKQDIIMQKLDSVHKEFTSIKADFMSTYSTKVDQWINHVFSVTNDVEFAHKLQASVLTESEVERRLGFDFQVFKLQPVSDDEADKLERRISGLGEDLIDEVVAGAKKFASTLFGKDKVAVTTRMTLVGIRDKVDGLAFLDGKLQPLADLISDTLKGYQLHSEGRFITAPFLYQVMATAFILSDRDKINSWGNGSIDIDQYANHYADEAWSGTPEQQYAVSNVVPADSINPASPVLDDDLEVELPTQAPPQPNKVAQAISFDDLDDIEVQVITTPTEQSVTVADTDTKLVTDLAHVAPDVAEAIEEEQLAPDMSLVAQDAAVAVEQDFFF